LTFPGANPHPRLEPFDRLDTVVSYFIGNDPDQWHPDVPVWGGVRYKDLYPGIDLELTCENDRLVQRLVAQPGANLNAVRLCVDGADALALDGDRLRLTTALGDLTLPLLRAVAADSSPLPRAGKGPGPALSNAEGVRANEITAPFVAENSAVVGGLSSAIGATGASDLLYATFLGGNSYDHGYAIAVDGSGKAYVTGRTPSSDFPTTPGAFDTIFNGDDAFVVKLNATGSSLEYATFLGGSDTDDGYGIAVDGSGNAYVKGGTTSFDFPTTPGAFDTTYNSSVDVFVVKLNATGSALAYATFLGGSDYDFGFGIAMDGSGAVYVTGETWSSDFPTTPGAFDTTYNGSHDAFVVKLNAAGSGLTYATFLGGSDYDFGFGIAMDGSGAVYVTGGTRSSDFPTTPGAFDTSYSGGGDAFVVKLNATGSSLEYATFLGGRGSDNGYGITVDGSGAAYVTGYTSSSDFPTTPGAFDTSYSGGGDAFVMKLNATGSALTYATFLGGSYVNIGSGIAVDGSGAAYVMGWTESSAFPTTPGAFDTTYNGSRDAFVVKLNATGSALAYATFLGGSGAECPWVADCAFAVDGNGVAYVTGGTRSSDFPTTLGAFDTTYNGSDDAFVAKLAVGGGSGLTISHIEVTQATQTITNTVPLIAGKPTFVRVYVDCGEGCTSLPNVTGRLDISSPTGGISLPPAPLTITVYHPDNWTSQRGDLGKTLNFVVTPTNVLTGTVAFTAVVSDTSRSETLTFQPTMSLNIIYVPIRYKGQIPDPSRISSNHWWASRVYPTAKMKYEPGTTMDWDDCLEVDIGCPFGIVNRIRLINELTSRYRLLDGYVFGWLPDETIRSGMADPFGVRKVAIGDDGSVGSDSREGPNTFAHEIAHLMGRRHTNTLDSKSDKACGYNILQIDPLSDWPFICVNLRVA
jgi:hypothetical protein